MTEEELKEYEDYILAADPSELDEEERRMRPLILQDRGAPAPTAATKKEGEMPYYSDAPKGSWSRMFQEQGAIPTAAHAAAKGISYLSVPEAAMAQALHTGTGGRGTVVDTGEYVRALSPFNTSIIPSLAEMSEASDSGWGNLTRDDSLSSDLLTGTVNYGVPLLSIGGMAKGPGKVAGLLGKGIRKVLPEKVGKYARLPKYIADPGMAMEDLGRSIFTGSQQEMQRAMAHKLAASRATGGSYDPRAYETAILDIPGYWGTQNKRINAASDLMNEASTVRRGAEAEAAKVLPGSKGIDLNVESLENMQVPIPPSLLNADGSWKNPITGPAKYQAYVNKQGISVLQKIAREKNKAQMGVDPFEARDILVDAMKGTPGVEKATAAEAGNRFIANLLQQKRAIKPGVPYPLDSNSIPAWRGKIGFMRADRSSAVKELGDYDTLLMKEKLARERAASKALENALESSGKVDMDAYRAAGKDWQRGAEASMFAQGDKPSIDALASVGEAGTLGILTANPFVAATAGTRSAFNLLRNPTIGTTLGKGLYTVGSNPLYRTGAQGLLLRGLQSTLENDMYGGLQQ